MDSRTRQGRTERTSWRPSNSNTTPSRLDSVRAVYRAVLDLGQSQVRARNIGETGFEYCGDSRQLGRRENAFDSLKKSAIVAERYGAIGPSEEVVGQARADLAKGPKNEPKSIDRFQRNSVADLRDSIVASLIQVKPPESRSSKRPAAAHLQSSRLTR